MKKEKKEKLEKETDKKECHCNENCDCGDDCNCTDSCKCNEECHCNEKECDCGCSDECKCEDCHCHEDEINTLKDNIKELEEKLAFSKAELINYRKRKDEEVMSMLKYANQDLILELLPVVDNFERAMALADKSNSELTKFLEGFNMLYIAIKDILKKFGVEEINEIDVAFDPNIHEALLVEENKEKENDTILEVLLKGYILKGRVIRPAQVKVNKIN